MLRQDGSDGREKRWRKKLGLEVASAATMEVARHHKQLQRKLGLQDLEEVAAERRQQR